MRKLDKILKQTEDRVNELFVPDKEIWRGKPLVPKDKWKWGDTTCFPDSFVWPCNMPEDWFNDWFDYLNSIQDTPYGQTKCYNCILGGRFGPNDDRASHGRESASYRIVRKYLLDDSVKDPCDVVNWFVCPYDQKTRDTLFFIDKIAGFIEHLLGCYNYKKYKEWHSRFYTEHGEKLPHVSEDEIIRAMPDSRQYYDDESYVLSILTDKEKLKELFSIYKESNEGDYSELEETMLKVSEYITERLEWEKSTTKDKAQQHVGDLNRTEANNETRLAGNEPQHEDQPKPERIRVGLRGE